ncbi:MAG: Uma2 family endonuclease [Planctomycetaceae bacterium]|nr:Uma2 family endonuclease [Planctomycetaceae bacterium]
MSAPTPVTPRLTAREFVSLVESGHFARRRVELLNGEVTVGKRHSPLTACVASTLDRWFVRSKQDTISSRIRALLEFEQSCPQPDHAIVRGSIRKYSDRFPNALETLLVIEVSGDSLDADRYLKGQVYAAEGVPEYWIVNCIERQVEVYTEPHAKAKTPRYRKLTTYLPGHSIPVHVAGKKLGELAVNSLFKVKK